MGQQQSRDAQLYQQVSSGNIEAIKSLHREGAGLEWTDKEKKTPLILACTKAELIDVAKTLIELGANVNAHRPGRHGGTALHHAAKRGLENTVKLLLSHGANPLLVNDDGQTPLGVAGATKRSNVVRAIEVIFSTKRSNIVRAIESHICVFSGWMRESYGPGILDLVAPLLLSRRVWVVITPCASKDPTKPQTLELAIYSSLQDAKPRRVVALSTAKLEEPKFYESDCVAIIVYNSITMPSSKKQKQKSKPMAPTVKQIRIKLAPANEGDRQQLQSFCDACKGIPQAAARPPVISRSPRPSIVQATAPPASEDIELAMAFNASIEPPMSPYHHFSEPSSSTNHSVTANRNGNTSPTTSFPPPLQKPTAQYWSEQEFIATRDSTPSAPAVDSIPLDANSASEITEKNRDGNSSTCVICLDAPSEAACVPCGHVAGCMSCLNEIKSKNWGCPVCRANIDQVVRLYLV